MCLLEAIFDSDSEYEWLCLIHSINSYKLNSITSEASIWKNDMTIVKISKRTGRLDDSLLSVVDETLMQVFREAGAKVIYDFLANNCHLKHEEIAEKPEVFSAGLERLMVSGAPVIEILILKNLYSKLGLEFKEEEGYGFSDYIRELRKMFERKGLTKEG
jgi:hypothetical protein